MSRINSTSNYGGFGGIVNGLAVFITITLVSVGYVSAIGSFAGIA